MSMMWSRPAVIAVLACVAPAAAGCSSTTDIMDSLQSTVHDFNPFGTSKKPLPGQRRAVFPEGVPGVEQGIPQHLMQGQQQIPDPNAPAVIAAPSEPPAAERPQRAKPRPTRTARPRPAAPPNDADDAAQPAPRRPAQARRQAPAAAPQPGQPAETAWPAPAQQQPAATQWPAPAPPASQPAATVWPDPPKAGTFTR
jgi:hypothetical protein